MNELLIAFFGAIFGGLITFWGESIFRKRDYKGKQKHSATILYNDLKSIQKYLNEEFSDIVNIRYTNEWQSYAARCDFLGNHEIALLYEIYDTVYDYNKVFDEGFYLNAKEQPIDRMFKRLSGKINHQNFKELMDLFINNIKK